ncbi:4'-phosphopantetheinyl transferase superfamily protein [Pseudonocardia bannensis]|uniref:4'-phosphopantetheinyl transferase superfamily protein n=1 Tax=Pseudonocardia bannensis TaxID=630973 RepID=A0A848DN99_9PSEU|nr:4'-phosphopantetheinyl transferase superfamily protein [Pseudonocardia bannensis]
MPAGRAACQAGGVSSTECGVWWARPLPPEGHPGLLALLDEHERTRLQKLRRPDDQARYLAAHALVRLVLGHRLGVHPAGLRFDRTCRCGQQHGKPRLADEPGTTGFSLTHSGDLVGVAVSDGPVGLDVEHVRPLTDVAGMAAHVCSPTELARPLPAETAAFLTTWTRKEALLKATGEGLSRPMATITLSPAGSPPRVEEWTGADAPPGPVWLADLLPAPEHPGAVAGFGARTPAIRVADGDAVLLGWRERLRP